MLLLVTLRMLFKGLGCIGGRSGEAEDSDAVDEMVDDVVDDADTMVGAGLEVGRGSLEVDRARFSDSSNRAASMLV